MRKLKLFDSFQETEYKKFGGIDITDVDSISFSWSNVPYFSDYYDHKGELGDPYIRIGMTKYLKQSLSEIDKDKFYDILISEGIKPKVHSNGYTINLMGQDLVEFLYIIENINEYK